MTALCDHDAASLAELFTAWGCKPSHAPRVLRSFYEYSEHVGFESLEIGHDLIRRLADVPQRRSRLLRTHRSADDTLKLLVGFTGGGAAEAVLMPSHRPDRAAGCVSSQIGCAMGCDFCAS